MQEDIDGKSELSHIRQVNIGGKPVIQVYPNPATSVLHIISDPQVRLKELNLLNMTGHSILRQRALPNGNSLDISRLPAGAYLLVLQHGNNELTYEKIIKR